MKRILVVILIFSFPFLDTFSVKADTIATTILSGGVSLRANYNITKTEAGTTDDWDSYASANISLAHSRRSKNGSFSTDYTQSFEYNLRTGEATIDSSNFIFNVDTWRQLSNRLRFNLSDTLIRTNDLWAENVSPTATGIPEPEDPAGENGEDTPDDTVDSDKPTPSVKIGREKFWTNYFSTGFTYQYASSGSVNIGYSNSILEYDEPDQDNYQRDRISTGISQGLAPRWGSSLSYSYTDAKFDINDDFTSHSGGFSLSYYHSVQDSFSAGVNYSEKNYDEVDPESPFNPNNNYTASANLGWTHGFSPTKTLSMSAGPSYYHEDAGEDRTSYNFNVNYTSRFEHGSWFVGANGGFEDRSFTGVETDQGISEYQSASTGVSWQVAKDINASLGANIRNDSFLENPLTSDEKTYAAYGNISYRFLRWFYVSGRYWYVNVDSDLDANDSEEHRFFITLGASRELYRWIH